MTAKPATPALSFPSPEEKMEADGRSVHVGNVSTWGGVVLSVGGVVLIAGCAVLPVALHPLSLSLTLTLSPLRPLPLSFSDRHQLNTSFYLSLSLSLYFLSLSFTLSLLQILSLSLILSLPRSLPVRWTTSRQRRSWGSTFRLVGPSIVSPSSVTSLLGTPKGKA